MGRRPCCVKEGLTRGVWSAKEDRILINYIKVHGEGKWRDLPQRAGLKRCGKSCRLRWLNYLRPGIKRGNISEEEEDLIIKLHKLLGNRWSLIAGRIPGRTDNEIKNYWNTNLSRRIQSDNAANDFKKSSDVSKLVQPSHEVIRTKATRFTKAVNINCCPQSQLSQLEAHNVINNLDSTNTGNRCFYSSETMNKEDQFLMDFDVDHFLLSNSPSPNLDRSNEAVKKCVEENVVAGGEFYGFENLDEDTVHLLLDDDFDHDSLAKFLREEQERTN